MTKAWGAILAFVISIGSAHSEDLVDLTKVERKISKEPKYQNHPHYALLVFGPNADLRAWMVMDGDDVLYIDRNGNGDLTEEGERVALDVEATQKIKIAQGAYKGMNVFEIGTVAGNRLVLNYWVRNKEHQPTDNFTKVLMKERELNDWENASLYRMIPGKGRAQNPIIFAARPALAQITNLGGRLTFSPKWGDRQRLKPNEETHFDVHVGSCCLPPRNCKETIFSPLTTPEVPKNLHPRAVFEFPNKEAGKPPIIVETSLNERC